ncbi:MAG: barstar family protein [Chloroflexi bacterium]|nr:barstar family protein [Chloroflexota bacterium]OJV93681.1 MAG: hypothetical protein BGO39_15300 [Chloroflexi bacterium 54-19]
MASGNAKTQVNMPDYSIVSQPVTYINKSDLARFKDALKELDFQVFELNGEKVRDAESLFEQAARDWPHPPYLTPDSWPALADCLWTSLVESAHPKVVLLWTEAQNMLDGGLPVLITGIEVVSSNLKNAAKKSKADPAEVYYRLVISGSGPNFPPFQAG